MDTNELVLGVKVRLMRCIDGDEVNGINAGKE